MKSYSHITRIGLGGLVLAGMVIAGPSAFAGERVSGIGKAGFHQPFVYDIVNVSQKNGYQQRFQPHTAGRSIQAIRQGNLNPAIHNRNGLRHRRSPTFFPLIIYPWNFGYHYGEMQTPEDVLIDYLEELYDRQEVAMKEQLIISPPKPAPPPLIIEERCGEYVRIPWPESGVLFEPVEEPPCPKTE